MIFAEHKDAVMKRFATESGPVFNSDIPERIINRWHAQFMAVPGLAGIPANPRLINKFTLGADPEFLMTDRAGHVLNAQNFGLQSGLAFGMDTNGRLVELRPSPSRFALDVVSSVLAELRWMSLMVPETMTADSWITDPFHIRDGVGGHIHFARKLNVQSTKMDTGKLDKLFRVLMKIGFYDEHTCQVRINETHYGRFGDYRIQKHGYEYRSMPTWMNTPLTAYLAIVLAKLTLVPGSPLYDALSTIGPKGKITQYEEALTNTLRYYKGQDDDALIALRAIEMHGWPRCAKQSDFRPHWGIMYSQRKSVPEIVPDMITPSEGDRNAVFNYLTQGLPIPPSEPATTWTPTHYLKGFTSPYTYSPTRGRIGLGELISGMTVNTSLPLAVLPYDSRYVNVVMIPTKFYRNKAMLETIRKEIENWDEEVKFQETSTEFQISISVTMREPLKSPIVRKFLLSGLFPIWKVGDAKETSLEEYVARMAVTTKEPKKPEAPKWVSKELKD